MSLVIHLISQLTYVILLAVRYSIKVLIDHFS